MEEILSPEENNRLVNVDNIVGLSTVIDDQNARRNAAGAGRGNGQAELQQRRRDAAAAEAAAAAEEERKKAAAAAAAKPVKVAAQKPVGKARPNPLFEYPDYTYGLSFHVIPLKKHNELVTTPGYVYKNDDKTILIASAGRRDNTNFQRHPKFNEDFFFENLKFTTIIGMNSRSKNTNAIELNFTLIEPYGFTFINRLLKVAEEFKTKSWMQIPFLLQIDFLGNSEEGKLMHPIPNQTKYIPVKLIGCKAKVTNKGAEYQIQCIPFSHQAFSETTASTPAFFEVQATQVKDFFSSGGSAGEADAISKVRSGGKERQEQLAKEIDNEKKKDPKSARLSELEKESKNLSQDVSNTSYVVGSYTAAMNSYQKQLKENNHVMQADSYAFVFDPEIADSKIVVPKKSDAKRTPMNKPDSPSGIAAIRAQAGLSTAGVDTSTETFTINAGTNVIEVINQVMRNTDYIRNQFTDPAIETPKDEKKPIDWYRIVPVIEVGEFDDKRDMYSKKITYYIKKYSYYNTKFRDAPKVQPSYNCKEYHYMYTGKNESIIDFNIDFDTMFFTAITADRSKVQKTSVQQKTTEDQKDDSTAKPDPVNVQNTVVHPVSGQADMVNPASVDSKAVLVNDFSKSIMSSSRGDMINVKLKIIGDPEMIKQDDIFYNPANNPAQGTNEIIDTKSNSIIYDAGEVFALLTFRTPVDWDPASGLMQFDEAEYSVFSGVYKIIQVENEFSRGQFTQTLDLIRLFDQPAWDTLEGSGIKKSNQRTKDAKTVAEATSPEPTEETNPQSDDATGVDEAVARERATNEVEAAEAEYRNPAANRSAEAATDISYDVAEQQKLLRQQLLAAPTVEYGNVLDLGLSGE
jgi:hypothetical protein